MMQVTSKAKSMTTPAAPRRMAPIALLLSGLLLAACTTTTITPKVVHKPSPGAQHIAVGEVDAAQALWRLQVPYFRKGLLAKLEESKTFVSVTDGAPETIGAKTVVVSGTITEVEKGSKALRFLIGFGAGSAKAAGRFQVRDAGGTTLVKFEMRKSYGGGAGIGGVDFLDMDELMEKLGTETANALIRWSKGEPIQPPESEE